MIWTFPGWITQYVYPLPNVNFDLTKWIVKLIVAQLFRLIDYKMRCVKTFLQK